MLNDLLIEIGCEELPPKALKNLATSFYENVTTQLQDSDFQFESCQWFATPRRLALLVKGLPKKQADKVVAKKGPAVNVAFDAEGNPTKAAQGWARSLGLTVAETDRLKTEKGEWLYKEIAVEGKNINSLLPDILQKSLSKLPIPKMMRWGNTNYQFVRPVQNICVLHGEELVDLKLFGIQSTAEVLGHRFMSDWTLPIANASEYQSVLIKNSVVANYQERQEKIRADLTQKANKLGLTVVLDDDLLDEVTALVEWPEVLTASFDEVFLEVPKEALIYTMKDDQKYFPMLDSDGELASKFMFVSNIKSKSPEAVIKGNEKVVRPRLCDAQFFFEEDKKIPADTRLDSLKSIVFQKELGTVYQRCERISKLASLIAEKIGANSEQARKAGLYCKSDLVSNMVSEFPAVQGVMGKYYALIEGENSDVAIAMEDHYKPRFSGDELPGNLVASSVALAEKIDTLYGIFSIGQIPTGDKDPFALRRNAIGILRILIEQEFALSLDTLFCLACECYNHNSESKELISKLTEFVNSRFVAYFSEKGHSVKNIKSVLNTSPDTLLLAFRQLEAISEVLSDESLDISTLVALNKRVSNILAKSDSDNSNKAIDEDLLTEQAEKTLYNSLNKVSEYVLTDIEANNFKNALNNLLQLETEISEFFDNVMVNATDESVKQNRLALLFKVRQLFLTTADLAELS